MWMSTSTLTTYLIIVADHVHPFMESVFPDGCGIFATKQKWFRNGLRSTATWPPSAANILVPDTIAHFQGSSGVHTSTGQG